MSTPFAMAEPFICTSGPINSPIVIVGEAWGEQEALTKRPFVGASGQELDRMLAEAGLSRSAILCTNTFTLHPEDNQIDSIFVSKDLACPGLPMYRAGKWLPPHLAHHLERLKIELQMYPRNLVIALGNTACWALLGHGRIGQIRGTPTTGPLCLGLKVLPTYHPAAVLRNWSFRPIVVADLLKARRESQFPEIRRPHRWVTINPSLDDIEAWIRKGASQLAVDIETGGGQIKCVGFARTAQDAIVIPFVDMRRPGNNYWPLPAHERQAWRFVHTLLDDPCPKIFQNGLYDLQYLWRVGMRPRNCLHDTMLLHHSLYPELQKGLGFLGSIYTDEASWKLLNRHSNDDHKSDE